MEAKEKKVVHGGLLITLREGESFRVGEDMLVVVETRHNTSLRLRFLGARDTRVTRLNTNDTAVLLKAMFGKDSTP